MKSFNKLAIGIGALGLLTAAPSFASPVLTFTSTNYGTQSLDVFGGFDWNSAASAVSTGFTGTTGDVITTTYWANAVGIQDPNGVNFSTPGITPATPSGGWEFTVLATITEVATCLNADCSLALFTTTSGNWDIYFDKLANASYATGAGFTDGDKVFSGNMNAGIAGTFLNYGSGGTGIFKFSGDLSYVNGAYVDTSLLNTTAVSTLQIGDATTAWNAPGAMPGGGSVEGIVFQADGNQSFHKIPEPGTMALLGLSLVGMGFGARRRKG
jgi:hypothetical protein